MLPRASQGYGNELVVTQVHVCSDGRFALIDVSDPQDIFDCSSWDARTQFHEYGGASVIFWDVIYFSYIRDHRVYKTTKGGNPHRSLQVILTSQPVQILAQL